MNYKVIIKDGHVQIVEVEKFNPYHDPKDGRFTTGGAGGGGKNTIRSTPGWSTAARKMLKNFLIA